MSDQIYFDESLPAFVDFLLERVSESTLESGIFLRDASGCLTFVVRDQSTGSDRRAQLSEEATSRLSPYVDDDGFSVATPEDLFDESLTDADGGWLTPVKIGEQIHNLRLIDRRVVGVDWLQKRTKVTGAPRIVFASLKGGVGRSTALCVAAAALAAQGIRVLAVDLDVEAPGLGTMLLEPDTMPRLGLLDFLVETNLGRSASDLMPDLISPSWLAAGEGIVDVLPALGASSNHNPSNVLSKIARAYVGTQNDQSDGVSSRLRDLLDDPSLAERYDVILIDSRAGFHETTGAALLGLGAHVFLFGANQPQTFAAYDLLFANLAITDRTDWSDIISVVQSKSNGDQQVQRNFTRKFREILVDRFSNDLYQPKVNLQALRDVFQIDWQADGEGSDKTVSDVLNSSGESFTVTHILESELFRDFDPLSNPDRLSPALYDAVYGQFLREIFRLAGGSTEVAADA